MSELAEIKQRIEQMRQRIEHLEAENEMLGKFVDTWRSYDSEGAAIYRAEKLVDLRTIARKLKR